MWYNQEVFLPQLNTLKYPALYHQPGIRSTSYKEILTMGSIPHFPQPENQDVKPCTKCGELKSLSEYYVKKRNTGQLFSWCKTCHSDLRLAKYYQERPEPKPLLTLEEKKARKAAYRAANSERRKAYNVAYREAHAEKVKVSNATYRAVNKEILPERQKAWRKANPERARKIQQVSRQAHKDTINALTHNRRARIKGNGGSYTVAEWQALKATFDHRCLMCNRQEPEIKLTVDHVMPISEGGSNTIDNLQPLCKSCSSKKT
jgi:5-methylcytosine-specific restriction endonuclease McrA